MEKTVQTFFDRLDERRDASAMTDRALSIKAGASPDLIRQARLNQRIPNARNLSRIADVLQVSVEWLLGRTDSQPPADVRGEVVVSDRRTDFSGFPPPLPADLPVVGTGYCGTVEFGENGEAVAIEETVFEPANIVRYIARPPALVGAKDAYAIYFQGDSMEPRFCAGEMAIADPRRPPMIGDDVIVQLKGGPDCESEDVCSVLVKRLVRRSSDAITLEQFNPPAVFKVPAARVARMHRIVPTGELLGG